MRLLTDRFAGASWIMLGVLATGQASAATGTITVTVYTTGDSPISKSSNISGPTFLRGTGTFTATIVSGGNNQSGTISADMVNNNYEYSCDSAFVTSVTNGVCNVSLVNSAGGYHGATCTYALGTVNHQTCDFTASFTDRPGNQLPPPPPP